MTLRFSFLVILVLLHCVKLIAFVQHYGLSSSIRRSRTKVGDNDFQRRVVHTRLHVLDNLVDCVANPMLGELYADSCLQTDGATVVVDSIAGLIRQAGTIGFLVMSYFFFKRSANGISDWDDEDDEDDEFDINDANSNNNFAGENDRAEKLSRCPQCNGTGKFEWDGDNYVSVCDLCNGAGMIARSTRVKALGLPISSRELWNPNGKGQSVNGIDDMDES